MAQSMEIAKSVVQATASHLSPSQLKVLARFLDEIYKGRLQAELKTPGLNEAQVCPSESGCTDAYSPDSGGTVAPYPYSGRTDASRLDSDDEDFEIALDILATPNSSSSAGEDGYPPTQSPLQPQPSGKEEFELYVDLKEVMFRHSNLYFPDIVKPTDMTKEEEEVENIKYKEAVQAGIDAILEKECYDDVKHPGKWFMERAHLCQMRYRRGFSDSGNHRCPLSNLPTDESEDLAGYILTRENFLSRELVKWEFVRALLDKVNPSLKEKGTHPTQKENAKKRKQFNKFIVEVSKGHCVLEMKIERKSPSTNSGKNTRGTKRPGGGSDGDNNNNGSGTPPEPSRGPDGSTDATGGTSSSGGNDTSSNKRQKQRPMGVHGSKDVQGALEEDVDDSEADSDDNDDDSDDEDDYDEDADGINDDRFEAAAAPAIAPRSEIRAEIPTARQLFPATPTKRRAYEDRPSKAEKMQAIDVDETRSVFTATTEEVPFQHTNIRLAFDSHVDAHSVTTEVLDTRHDKEEALEYSDNRDEDEADYASTDSKPKLMRDNKRKSSMRSAQELFVVQTQDIVLSLGSTSLLLTMVQQLQSPIRADRQYILLRDFVSYCENKGFLQEKGETLIAQLQQLLNGDSELISRATSMDISQREGVSEQFASARDFLTKVEAIVGGDLAQCHLVANSPKVLAEEVYIPRGRNPLCSLLIDEHFVLLGIDCKSTPIQLLSSGIQSATKDKSVKTAK